MAIKETTPSRPLRVLISGGGTGGHIFPALSIAAALKRRNPDTEILFVGALGRMEMQRVPDAGYEIIGLPVAGFNRKNLFKNISVLFKLRKSLSMARKIVKDFKPDIAVGVGGYASGPTLKAAQKLGVPTLLQEQNSYAGVTNKLLAANAKAICVAYPEMERFFPAERIIMTGNPVRPALLNNTLAPAEAKKSLGFEPSKPMLLVVGGSLGARTLNETLRNSARDLAAKGMSILWQTGKNFSMDDAEKAELEGLGVKVTPFVSDMATAYKAADLTVSRAGASSISELQLLGKPVVLVPSPNVAEDHQKKNALALSTRGAAVLVEDAEAAEKLPEVVETLIFDTEKLSELSSNIRKLALPDADEKIVDKIMETVNAAEA